MGGAWWLASPATLLHESRYGSIKLGRYAFGKKNRGENFYWYRCFCVLLGLWVRGASMSFDMEPDAPLHGECLLEIRALQEKYDNFFEHCLKEHINREEYLKLRAEIVRLREEKEAVMKQDRDLIVAQLEWIAEARKRIVRSEDKRAKFREESPHLSYKNLCFKPGDSGWRDDCSRLWSRVTCRRCLKLRPKTKK